LPKGGGEKKEEIPKIEKNISLTFKATTTQNGEKMKKFLCVISMLMFLFLWVSGPAQAAFVLYLDDLSTPGVDVILADNQGVGFATAIGPTTVADTLGQLGAMNYMGTAGVFSLNITTGISKPVIGNSFVGSMDLNSVNVSGGAGTLQIGLTDTDFLLTGQDTRGLQIINAWGGTTNGSITAQGWLDPANAEFGTGAFTTGLQGPFGPGAFSATASAPVGVLGTGVPFSLTEAVTITHTAAGQSTSFNKSLSAVPEPTTILLSGLGLLCIGAYLRRRFK